MAEMILVIWLAGQCYIDADSMSETCDNYKLTVSFEYLDMAACVNHMREQYIGQITTPIRGMDRIESVECRESQ